MKKGDTGAYLPPVTIDGERVSMDVLIEMYRYEKTRRKDKEAYRFLWEIDISDGLCAWRFPLPNNCETASFYDAYEAVRDLVDAPTREGRLIKAFRF